MTTVFYARTVKRWAWPAFDGRLWQRNYHEHVIPDEATLQLIREYILANPTIAGAQDHPPAGGFGNAAMTLSR